MKLLNLQQIEGFISPHTKFLKDQILLRSKHLINIKDVEKIARYIGGEKVVLNLREDWCIKKEVFPEVEIYFLFNNPTDEFKENLRVLFGGERVKYVPGEDLASLTIFIINHIIRSIKENF